MAFLWFYRTKRVISQGYFKLHWWVHQTGGTRRWIELFYVPQMLIFLALGLVKWYSAKLVASKRFCLFLYRKPFVQIRNGARTSCSKT